MVYNRKPALNRFQSALIVQTVHASKEIVTVCLRHSRASEDAVMASLRHSRALEDTVTVWLMHSRAPWRTRLQHV